MAEVKPAPTYSYPFAAAPDIIRSNQKDAYFQGLLLEQVSGILRQLKGARFAHNYTTEARTFAELLYLGLTTFIGNRTLGEEYCDIVQIDDVSRRLPSIAQRSGYILSSVLIPYGLNKILPAFRKRLRVKLEASLKRSSKKNAKQISPRVRRFQQYLLDHLDAITSPSPLYALSLATFYFSGAYYHLGKRIWNLRYIFTRTIEPSEQRVGYEVLGVLLVLQMAVQAYLHIHNTATAGSTTTIANPGAVTGGTAVLDHGVEVSLDPNAYSSNNALLFESNDVGPHSIDTEKLQKMMHTPVMPEGVHRYHLTDPDSMKWINGKQQRKCTLCLEELKDPSVTTCGHVFCWTCIGDWCREKPECPLCRQVCLVQHILPLRG